MPCLGWGEPGFSLIGDPYTTILVASRSVLGLDSGLVALRENDDQLVVHRVVGQVDVVNATEAPVTLLERIVVGLYDDDNLAAFFADDYQDASQANEPFLWQRVSTQVTGGVSSIDSPLGHPFWSVVDVRSKRKLERDEALFYRCQVVGAVGAQARIIPYLRCWVTETSRQ